jgi:hypothetical protein
MATSAGQPQAGHERYFVEVDEVEVSFEHEEVTGGEIMDRAGVPRAVGLVQILPDGTQQAVGADTKFELEPGHRFKKRPRFKRG